jgi:transposase
MRPVGSAAELERRRRRAVRLVQAGHSLSAVARMVGAAVSAVWQWRETWRRKGEPGLKARPCGFSKLDPHEFIGGFERLAIERQSTLA